ncbi:MAG: hypothetical protein RLZZ293_988 [Pseudomonadota bacterium]|jgi:hypothetical protein
MDLLEQARQKLNNTLEILQHSTNYQVDIQRVLEVLDDGLQFSKQHYSELNALTLQHSQQLNGADIYFFFMRFTHQFFNVMNIVQTVPNASYYNKFLALLATRQERFEELRRDAIAKGLEIL